MKMLNKNFKNKLVCIFDRHEIFPWPWTFADEIITKDIGKLTEGEVFSVIIEEFINGHIYHYINEEEVNMIGEQLAKTISKNKSFYRKILKKVYFLSSDLKKLSVELLTRFAPDGLEVASDVRCLGVTGPDCTCETRNFRIRSMNSFGMAVPNSLSGMPLKISAASDLKSPKTCLVASFASSISPSFAEW